MILFLISITFISFMAIFFSIKYTLLLKKYEKLEKRHNDTIEELGNKCKQLLKELNDTIENVQIYYMPERKNKK